MKNALVVFLFATTLMVTSVLAHGQTTPASTTIQTQATDRTNFSEVVLRHYTADSTKKFTEDGYKYVFADLPSSQFLSARPLQYRVSITTRDGKKRMYLTLCDARSLNLGIKIFANN